MTIEQHAGTAVSDLVEAALRRQPWAWDLLVERYRPLVRAVARGHRLDTGDSEDIAQVVWLRLVEHLGRVRDPRALPRWISTTARHECLRLVRRRDRAVPVDPQGEDITQAADDAPGVDAALLRDEERASLRAGLAELTPAHRELLLMLAVDPPPSYREVSRRLGIPVGSIGPTRARGLARLRLACARDAGG